MNKGLHPVGLYGLISTSISKYLSVSKGLTWDRAVVLEMIVKPMVALKLTVFHRNNVDYTIENVSWAKHQP